MPMRSKDTKRRSLSKQFPTRRFVAYCLGGGGTLLVFSLLTIGGVITTYGPSGSELALLGIGILLIGVVLALEEIAKTLSGAGEIIALLVGALNDDDERWSLMTTHNAHRVRSRIRELLNLESE